jgi:hypothetical protein
MARYKAPEECTGVSIGASEYASELEMEGERYVTVPDEIAHELLLSHGFERVSDVKPKAEKPVPTRRRRV